MIVLTSDEIRKVEEYEDANGIKFTRLMENAGSAVARVAYSRLVELGGSEESVKKKEVLVVCGKGRNGGDGFVVARRLFQRDVNVTIILAAGNPIAEDSRIMLERATQLGVPLYNYLLDGDSVDKMMDKADMIIDAIFGIGFHGEPNELIAGLFDRITKSSAYVLSVDIPSGLIADVGTIQSKAICADETIAISALKPAHILKPAHECCGAVSIVEIGISKKSLDQVKLSYAMLTKELVTSFLRPRRSTAYKGNFGHLFSMCGSYRMPGAAKLVLSGAVHSGVGLVTAAIPEKIYPVVANHMPEPMYVPVTGMNGEHFTKEDVKSLLPLMQKASAIVLGCGMSKNDDTKAFVFEVLEHATCPVLLDADALNSIAGKLDVLEKTRASIILTPHPGEMARLVGVSVETILANPIKCANDFVNKYPVTLVLKGANTVIAHRDELTVVNAFGNAGMAKGGTGDLLSGIIASHLAQGLTPYKAASVGVYIHAVAGDSAKGKFSEQGMTPSDMADELKNVYKTVAKESCQRPKMIV